jgi:hypothetical protein
MLKGLFKGIGPFKKKLKIFFVDWEKKCSFTVKFKKHSS